MRRLHVNARDYQEPFHLLQVNNDVDTGIRLDIPVRTVLLFGSILNRDTLISNNQLSDGTSKLSIKIVNQQIGIKMGDRIQYNGSQFVVDSVTRNYYNNGEVVILCNFEKDLNEIQTLNTPLSFRMVS